MRSYNPSRGQQDGHAGGEEATGQAMGARALAGQDRSEPDQAGAEAGGDVKGEDGGINDMP